MVIEWESPVETHIKDPDDQHTLCNNMALRTYSISQEITPLEASATLAFMPHGSTSDNVGCS